MPYEYYFLFLALGLLLFVVISRYLPLVLKDLNEKKVKKIKGNKMSKADDKKRQAMIYQKRQYLSKDNEIFYYLQFVILENNDEQANVDLEPKYEEYLVPKADYYLYQEGTIGLLIVKSKCYIKFIKK